MTHVASIIGCTRAEVEDVVSYYVMFFTQPVGKYVLQVCRTLSCGLNGAGRVIEELSRQLGIGLGETTADGLFTLMEMECLGACDRAPGDHGEQRALARVHDARGRRGADCRACASGASRRSAGVT